MSSEDLKKVEEKKSDDDKKISADEKKSDDDKKISADEKKSDDDKKISADEKKSDDDKKVSADEKKSDDDKKVSADEKKSDDDKKNSADEKKSDDDKKVSADEKKSDDDEKNSVEEVQQTLQEKFSSYLDKARDYLDENFSGYFEDISLKYVATVVGGVLFFIGVVGLTLIFVDPLSLNSIQKNSEGVENSQEKKVHVKIHEGMSTAEIADKLEEKNVIASSLKFRFLSRIRGYDGQMKPGTYIFYPGTPDDEVFEKILNGEKMLVKFTIPEGFNVKEIAERLYSLDLADKEDFLKAAENFSPYDYMKKRKNTFYAAEGFLFPDTYTVESDVSIEEILKIMAENFDKRLTTEMRLKAQKMNLSIYDLITLSSLVEKEVRYPEDRPIVAQVFLKRLKINMPLQTDASLQYLMDAPKEDVSIEDTQIESHYNTYQNYGLPPGPVANPGMDSIEAVLNPADTDYLYFVADRNGHNHYAYTYDEHLYLVNQYR